MLTKLTLLLSLVSFGIQAAREQPQRPSYIPGHEATPEIFETAEKHRLELNKYIPTDFDGIRFLTYNVHQLKDLHGKKDNFMHVLNQFREFNPTVAVLQEVISDPENVPRLAFERELEDLGYKYRHCRDESRNFVPDYYGNMIVSKIPFESAGGIDIGNGGSLIEVNLKLVNGAELTIYGTKLDSGNYGVRVDQAKTILKYIQARSPDNFILGADFNDTYDSMAMEVFTDSGIADDSFRVLGWTPPSYTWWRGTTVDFGLVSEALYGDCVASYVLHSPTSYHLPIIVDLKLPMSRGISRKSSKSSSSNAPRRNAPPGASPDAASPNAPSKGASGSNGSPSSSTGANPANTTTPQSASAIIAVPWILVGASAVAYLLA
jgi:exonuclease III